MSKSGAILRASFGPLRLWLPIGVLFVGFVTLGEMPARWNYYWLFAIFCWLILDIFWAVAARSSKHAGPAGTNPFALVIMVAIYTLYCLPLSSVPLLGQRVFPSFVEIQILGAMLCAFGIGFSIWARQVLAESWNAAAALRENHALIRHGPYAIVRHPIYFGFLVAVVGMILVLGEIRAFALVFGIRFLLKKMRQEERLLRVTFSNEYPGYERDVKKILPWIW
jgi:protein-S-isoprenylcysteine O-methyltransferase Ste14